MNNTAGSTGLGKSGGIALTSPRGNANSGPLRIRNTSNSFDEFSTTPSAMSTPIQQRALWLTDPPSPTHESLYDLKNMTANHSEIADKSSVDESTSSLYFAKTGKSLFTNSLRSHLL